MSKVLGKNLIAIAAAIMLAAFVMLVGCSSQQASSASSASSSAEAATQKADVVVGKESNTARTLVVKNATGKAITGLALGEAGSADDALTTLEVQGGEWSDGQTAVIYYEPTSASFFDILFKCGEDAFKLHEFNVDGAENIEAMMDVLRHQ